MSLPFSSDQQSFQKSLRDFLQAEADSAYLRKRIESKDSSDQALWKKLLDLGLISYFASADVDTRGTARELGIIAYEVGRGLLGEAVVDVILSSTFFYHQLASQADKAILQAHFGTDIAAEWEESKKRTAFAPASLAEPISLELRNKGPLYRVNGRVPLVKAADHADHVLFFAQSGKGTGESLFLADLRVGKEQRVEVAPCGALDLSQKYFDVNLVNVAALELSKEAAAALRIHAGACVAQELSGICGRAVEITTEFVKTRKQFGVPVGGFQAVQHRLADMHVQAESMRALSHFASWALEESKEQAQLASHSALIYALDHAPGIVEGAIQLHGGIGFTWEYDLHLFLRRAKMLELIFGSGQKKYDAVFTGLLA